MIYKTSTKTPLQRVKDEFEEHTKEKSFGVLGSYEFKKILHSKGFDLEKDITVYEVCNPNAALKILTAFPEISAYLPCRISVYEENGETVITTIDMRDVVKTLDVDADYKAHMNSVFEILINIMNSWK
ncbi:DUF302 domain-containing protein [Sulfurimonas sp. SAG-AH-194-L11]|nr:DUF302 domain-containing protein [Sulfurimonas sp. SAG-AH-194-L11]MDF1877707.1 DUF302 domain-containing protein [Sulfurimonas sp. SAG-AH-194-L11]